MNFYALLNFVPVEYSSVFSPDPVKVGLRAFPSGVALTLAAVFGNAALSWFKGHNRILITMGCIIMSMFLPLSAIASIS